MRLLIDRNDAAALHKLDGIRFLQDYAQHCVIQCDTPPTTLARQNFTRLDDKPLFVHGREVTLADGALEFGGEPHTLIKFIGPVDAAWLQALNAADVSLRFFCPPYGACVRVPEVLRSHALIETFPFVCAATPYREQHCSRGLAHEREKMTRGGVPSDACDVVFFSREDRARTAQALAEQQVDILDQSNYKLRVRYSDDLSVLRDIVGVKIADHARSTRLCVNMDLASAVARPQETTQQGINLRGKGQIIAVADTGLDSGENNESLHPDFQGRVKAILSLPLNSGWQGVAVKPNANDSAADRDSGHGTHVAGLALGSGERSAGLHQGVAPEAQLVFQAMEQYVDIRSEYRDELRSGYYLSGRPLDLRDLFKQARDYGARIHINAWGDEAAAHYTDDCYEADHFLFEHTDALVMFAAGNSGADRDGNRILDQQSLYAPASAKNVVAVGATEGGIADIGLRTTWGGFDNTNSRFRSSVDRADAISGEAERIALFSSAGPSRDGRIKPDICAPGTNLAAPRSRSAAGKGWGLASPLPHYMYNGGTSMAVGVAGGAAAILREAWEQAKGQPPSGPALKALLVLSTTPVLSRRDNQPEPPYVGGFGRVQINRALPQSTDYKLSVFDEREHGLASGEVRDYPISIGHAGELCAVLCWYDAPGETVINNLNVCLIDRDGNKTWGNHRPGERGAPDVLNTVERIAVDALTPGQYVLRVIGANVPLGPQSYALAIRQPVTLGPEIPLSYLRGIGVRLAARCAMRGVATIAQLMVQPEVLSQIGKIPSSLLGQLTARLQLLGKVRNASHPEEEFNTITLNQLLYGKKPARIVEERWLNRKEQCAPMVLVFNKKALAKISLHALYD